MIKINSRSSKVIISEAVNGESYWLAEPKKEFSNDRLYDKVFIIISDINRKRGVLNMMFKNYNLQTGVIGKNTISTLSGWNFREYNFFILTKEEASPYIKRMIVDSLIEKQE